MERREKISNSGGDLPHREVYPRSISDDDLFCVPEVDGPLGRDGDANCPFNRSWRRRRGGRPSW
eukprot:12716125-Prorocentrum_lima.AAC.1